MKIKNGFVMRKVAESYVVIYLGENLDFNSMITLNETGALIWKGVSDGKSEKEIARLIADEYDISEGDALRDVCIFIEEMRKADVLE